MIMDEAARLDMAAEAEDARLVGDPSIAVGDLEKGLESNFSVVGYRNMQEILDCRKAKAVKAKGVKAKGVKAKAVKAKAVKAKAVKAVKAKAVDADEDNADEDNAADKADEDNADEDNADEDKAAPLSMTRKCVTSRAYSSGRACAKAAGLLPAEWLEAAKTAYKVAGAEWDAEHA